MTFSRTPTFLALATCLLPFSALAHVSIASGPGFANTTQEITFGIGHGCSGQDTSSVTIDLPDSVQKIRAETSDFGRATINRDEASQKPISVTWVKPDADLLATDDNYYKLTIRVTVPDAPFTMLFFPAHQTCKKLTGETTVVDWIETEPQGTGEPAPALTILPARTTGWNKVKVPVAIADLSLFFKDAQIVWKGDAAYSSNANTVAQIANTAGATVLTSVAANDELWVKY